MSTLPVPLCTSHAEMAALLQSTACSAVECPPKPPHNVDFVCRWAAETRTSCYSLLALATTHGHEGLFAPNLPFAAAVPALVA